MMPSPSSEVPTTPPSAVKTALQINREDLANRLSEASAPDTCKGMFFNGLFQAVTRLQVPHALDRMKTMSEGHKFIDFFNYPIEQFLPLAWLAADLVTPTPGTIEDGFRSLGRQATDDFLRTAVGKTLLLLAGTDPRRLMSSLASGYKTAVSYGQRTLTWTTNTSCLFRVRRDFMPHPYHEGVLRQVIEAVGAKDVHAVGVRLSTLDTDYQVSWSAQ